jgi:hypothetical protein
LLEPGTFDRRADGLGDRLGGYADVLELELRNRHTAKQATLIAARPALAAWLDRVDAATRPG